MSSLCLFEDEGYRKLLPLVYLRPVWELRCGILPLFEKIQRQYSGTALHFAVRSHLVDIVRQRYKGALVGKRGNTQNCLFLNGRLLADGNFWKMVPLEGPDQIFISQGTVVAARLSRERLESLERYLTDFMMSSVWDEFRSSGKVKITEVEAALIQYPWDLVEKNREEIGSDFRLLTKGGALRGTVHEDASVYQKEQVYVGEGSDVMAQVVLDARGGPIYIGKNVTIMPHTRVEGPTVILDQTRILGGKIRTGSNIGTQCRVGGEVEDTIIHGYSNKQHDGFLGHAYVGEWVNLGAGTTNSDLKNNYGHVKVWNDGELRDTGETFIGCFIGDHTKTGIGTLINTGSVMGVAANFFGGGVTPKFVPSFAWGGAGGFTEHRLADAIGTARTVMGRRDVEMTPAIETMLREVYSLSQFERAPATLTR